MKHFLLAIAATLLFAPLPAQKLTTDPLAGKSLYETYQIKAHRKVQAARTLKYVALGSAAASGVWFLVAANKRKRNPDDMFPGLGEGIAGFSFGVIAVGSGLTSIFLNTSAKKYRKAAVQLTPGVAMQATPGPASARRPQFTGTLVMAF